MIFNRIIIAGCGPAGMSCAIQLKRMGLDPLVVEEHLPGGMLVNANLIENYPGFPGGISGPDLTNRMLQQFHSFNIPVHQDKLILVKFDNGSFILNGGSDQYRCNILVLATGTAPDVPAVCPVKLVTEGFIHFDIRNLRQVQGKTIGIVGAGDAAFDYSLTLAENENKVLIFNRGNQVKALKALSVKVFIHKEIQYLENTRVERVEMQQEHGIQAICNSGSSHMKYPLDYLIFATGREPALEFLDEEFRTKADYLVNEHWLYFIGDAKNGAVRQVSVAVGDGVRAAMEIFQHESNQ